MQFWKCSSSFAPVVARWTARSIHTSNGGERNRQLPTPGQYDVGCRGRRQMGGALIAQGVEIEAVQQMFARPEQSGRDGDMQLVDETGVGVLAYRRHAAADLDILPGRSLRRWFQRLAWSVGDEVEHSSTFHLD